MLATRMRMAGGVVDCTFITSAVDNVGRTAYTFAGQSFGVASANRYIVVATGAAATSRRLLSSVTIGGVAATIVEKTTNAAYNSAGIAIAAVPTGATGDVVVVFDGGQDGAGIGVYRLTGLRSATPTATAQSQVAVGNVLSASLAIPVGGCGIGYANGWENGALRTWVWTNLTENFDEAVETTTSHTGAMSKAAGTATRSATASGSLFDEAEALVLAAWR